MALVDSLRYVVTADTADAQQKMKALGDAAKNLEKLEVAAKKLEAGASKSASGLAKFNAATAAVTRARAELDSLTVAAAKPLGAFEKLKGAFAQGLGLGSGVVAVQSLTAGLEKFATFAVDQFGAAVNAASSLQQAVGSTEAIFGRAAGEVKAFGKTAAESVGLSNAAFQQQTAVIGSLLQNLGKTKEEAASTSIELVKIGADLGASIGRPTGDAVQALGAALRGEYDSIEGFGVSMKQAAVNARVLKLGLDTSTTEMLKQANATAALSIIYEQAGNRVGTFAAKQDTLRGQQQRFNAELENARAELGEALLPAMTELVRVARSVIGEIDTLQGAFQGMASDVKVVADLLPSLYSGLLGLGQIAGLTGADISNAFKSALSAVPGIGPHFAYLSVKMAQAREEAERNKTEAQALLDAFGGFDAIIERGIGLLPPALREAARETFGLSKAAERAEASLKALNDATAALGSTGDTLFGIERQQTAFNKSLEAGGDAVGAARSQAKAYESALRRIEDAERSLTDAQETLNESLISRFLVGLGASSDEITTAQIAERESTRSLAEAKLRLIDAQQSLNALRDGGQAASRAEAQASFLEAQKTLAEATLEGDPAKLLRAKAGLVRAQQDLNRVSGANQAAQLEKAQLEVAAAEDNVTSSAIAQRAAQRELNDTMIRGKEGSIELRDANREVEQAQRNLEDQTRNLEDAQDGLVDALNRTSAAGKTAAERFDAGVVSADAWIKKLVDGKKSPQEFAAAIDEITTKLQAVATEAGKTDQLDAYNAKLRESIELYTQLGGFGSKEVSGVFPKGTFQPAGPSGPAGPGGVLQTVQVILDGKILSESVVKYSNEQGGLPIRIRPTN